eukprot:217547-Hanusia_phi.AAC.1
MTEDEVVRASVEFVQGGEGRDREGGGEETTTVDPGARQRVSEAEGSGDKGEEERIDDVVWEGQEGGGREEGEENGDGTQGNSLLKEDGTQSNGNLEDITNVQVEKVKVDLREEEDDGMRRREQETPEGLVEDLEVYEDKNAQDMDGA